MNMNKTFPFIFNCGNDFSANVAMGQAGNNYFALMQKVAVLLNSLVSPIL